MSIHPTDVLNVRFKSRDLGETLTVRDYLKRLLIELFREGESFSGKRPFGNSGWEHDIAFPLIACGFLKGTLDEDDCVDEIDWDEFNAAMAKVIGALR
jgi:hypothetical protein